MTGKKNFLVLGSGGREHAAAWKIAKSGLVGKVLLGSGNAGVNAPGMEKVTRLPDLPKCESRGDFRALADVLVQHNVHYLFVGPEAPLVEGVTDYVLANTDTKVVGPSRKAARLEGSKVYAKRFMEGKGIRTAGFNVVRTATMARRYAMPRLRKDGGVVMKADGLAAGKGAIVCRDEKSLDEAIDAIMVAKKFGAAGNWAVVEDMLVGEEASIIAFSDGTNIVPFPATQDHKPIFDGDKGPNTGGMGAYSPTGLITPELATRIYADIMQKTVDGMRADGVPFVGILYAGIMVVGDQIYVLEYNIRGGDPETQPLLFGMNEDLVPYLIACAEGQGLGELPDITGDPCVCVVDASYSYPDSYIKGWPIAGLGDAAAFLGDDGYVFHAGTAEKEGQVVTNGGRVLGITAKGSSIRIAQDKAYRAEKMISWPGKTSRKDIAAKELERMAE